MSRKPTSDKISAPDRSAAFSSTGRVLRKAFAGGLVAAQDPVMDDFLRILSETSPHDMGSC
ncbi:hypothetical protein [Sphingomonas sp. CFBP 13720]|uniref:hypothetical protein n=1 Tax=Sphingomonas sp. CFBP 13720 TaxID=2775302 RepID=UPI00177C7DD2|nr:hypothetical protein [Sphingomonas sp. CFBP 13720]MBD8678481.1 hypothetical protein [Sphingomonas sp. CFBP 13720]